MTQPSTGGYVPNEVIAIKLDALTDEVRELRRELVRRDVYDAQRQHDQGRIDQLEARLGDQQAMRRQTGFALFGALLALGVALVRPLIG